MFNKRLELTPGEALWLVRQRNGLTQEEYRDGRWGEEKLRKMEHGLNQIPGRLLLAIEQQMEAAPPTSIEVCTIWRRRAGWTQAGLAQRMNVSRLTIHEWEHGRQACWQLIEWWASYLKAKGITGPWDKLRLKGVKAA
jgi:DNA-binding transcriptional regulator YiaG